MFAFAAILLAICLLLAYAYLIEPSRLVIHEESLKIPNWSANLNGFKIVAISDIHGGSNNVTEEKIRLLVERVNAQNPDLIVLLGDYVSQKGGMHSDLKMPSETVAENLKGFQAKYGVFAVIGNHDWWYNEKKVTAEFENAGIKVLDNKVEPIQIGDEKIYLWGIEDYWKNRSVPKEPVREIKELRNIIAITHNPDSILEAPNEISLMLAGHSHGGQVNFPIFGAHAFVNDARFIAGEAITDGKHVFVTTGVGCTGPQIRFRVPPEIAVLKLFAE
jgi:predicted MPP superfamily phosphohydrolase